MASVTKEKSGYRITWRDGDKRRRRIRVSGLTKRQAEGVASRIQSLAGAKISGEGLDTATRAWVRELGDDLHAKLADHGLVEPRRRTTLKAFIDDFITKNRSDVGERTALNWMQARDRLVEYFGDAIEIRDITEADAEEWQRWLRGQRLKNGNLYAKATVSGHTEKSKRFFNAAVKSRYIDRSPFAGLTSGSQVNDERNAYISCDDVEIVINQAPDAEWRLIIALGRFAGLRMPSEALRLKWEDVDWQRNRMTVKKGKTKKREMPILPQLRPYLEDCFNPEATHVIVEHRHHSNWGTTFARLIRKAGLEVWPRIFHNLRASLETDLTYRFPIHVVTSWLGNSPKIAADHYLSVRDADFEQAVALGVGQGVGQQLRETARNESQAAPGVAPRSAENQGRVAVPAGFSDIAVPPPRFERGFSDGESDVLGH